MKALFVARATDPISPWYPDFVEALGGLCTHERFNPLLPTPPQFEGVEVVVDMGGHGSDDLVQAAADAGVRLWQVLGTGLDGLDVSGIQRRGLVVSHTPGHLSAVALAEHAHFLMLALAKRYPESRAALAAGRMSELMNRELSGATLLILGLGASGQALASRAAAIGMTIDAVDPVRPPTRVLRALAIRRFAGLDELPDLLGVCDYLSIHVPLTDSTRGLINSEALAHLRPSAAVINVSRGEVIDEQALTAALAAGRMAGAGLDVFSPEPPSPDNPLLHMGNVIATPHVAGATTQTSRRRAQACVENIRRLMSGEPLQYLVPDGRP